MNDTTHQRAHEPGFTLVEVLIVIVILGVLASVVVVSVGGVTAGAEDTACLADRKTLEKAAEAYFAQRHVETIPDAGGPEGVEQTLLDEHFLGTLSIYYDLSTDGALSVDTGSNCTL